MISSNITLNPSSKVNARVGLYKGSTFVTTCTCEDRLQDFAVERIGQNGKFFGFGIIHKLKINLIDLERTLDITKEYSFKVSLGVNGSFKRVFPTFYADEIQRDENTNTISIVAYDKLYQASSWKYSDLNKPEGASYSFSTLAAECAYKIGITTVIKEGIPSTDTIFNTTVSVVQPANFDGEENFREIFDAVSEATQTIYYLNSTDRLVFKRLDKSGASLLNITKEDYIDFSSGEVCTLTAICSATELGDNVTAPNTTTSGITQYIRENPLLVLRTDIALVLNKAITNVKNLAITNFTLNWFGNFLMEPGDKITIETEDGGTITTYILSDVITFDGTLSETTEWKYEENASETASNPVGLGEVLNKTFARVDKAEKEITLFVSETEQKISDVEEEVGGYSERITQLTLDTEGIAASVENVQTNLDNSLNGVNNEISTLTKRVEATITPEEVQLKIDTSLEQGTTKVETSTGYTFNEEGLHISKSGSGVENLIDNTGMYVKRDGTDILVANTNGVEATNLHAKTYLIIGENSRFEDYYNNGNRTGCFFIGG